MSVASFDSSIREVIEVLFENAGWVDLFSLHEKYVLSPAQVLEAVERLEGGGFAERDGIKARLLDRGRDWVIASRRTIFLNPSTDWRIFDERKRLIDVNEPYLPDLSRVDKKFFKDLSN